MEVPFLDLGKTHQAQKDEILAQISGVIDRQWFITGTEVAAFESEYAAFSQTKFSVGVGNGLDALVIALKSLGVGRGDEVIVPANSFIATALAASFVGANVILADPSDVYYNLTPEAAARKITKKTKAVIPVHLYGQACDMVGFKALAEGEKLFLVEDNAQAQGATSHGLLTGSVGHINATSFYPGKNLGAFGDAGGITTNDKELAYMSKLFRSYGSSEKYHHEVLGQNSRLDEIQAAVLRVKLRSLVRNNTERQKIAGKYNELLADISALTLPRTLESSTHVHHLYVIRTLQRDELQKFLKDQGIQTLIHYPIPIHLQKAYSSLGHAVGDFPVAEELAATSLSLPLYPGLSDEQIAHVATCVRQFFR